MNCLSCLRVIRFTPPPVVVTMRALPGIPVLYTAKPALFRHPRRRGYRCYPWQVSAKIYYFCTT
jgi:hypothetical protein